MGVLVYYTRVEENVSSPWRADEGSLFDVSSRESAHVGPGCLLVLATGLAFRAPAGYHLKVYPRSSVCLRGLELKATTTGPKEELLLIVRNQSSQSIYVSQGDRIGQLELEKQRLGRILICCTNMGGRSGFPILLHFLREGAGAPNLPDGPSGQYHLRCCEETFLPPESITSVRTGIALELPRNHRLILTSTSKMTLEDLEVAAGVIDWTYRGEIFVLVRNLSKVRKFFYHGQSIARCELIENLISEFKETESLSQTQRGTDGLGSTGR